MGMGENGSHNIIIPAYLYITRGRRVLFNAGRVDQVAATLPRQHRGEAEVEQTTVGLAVLR